ncbi:SH3-binding, glutamic acid-rich protein-domain-containing protein [Cokeromyces recurvatus]|uniref:SH3-binding, glutamic acid-rich protein-domain-containing protein n=1 Tax=Cokeromyces recurvatus TaxID=90255 RepID=UPI00221F2186|nr:SH3-binding, glutamic acid-rich protein-domain-containing protein [Cokeromyces recurvatus]KAI7901635.1 SH3-binding, glutamic acid-rich protein-domain-containing protein [Cokeromyces recurvatus]
MVCLGPRKKEKKNSDEVSSNSLSPRSMNNKKAANSKLKPNNGSHNLLAPPPPSSMNGKKSPRSSFDSTKKSTLHRPSSRNALLPTGQTPTSVRPQTTPQKSPVTNSRPNSAMSVKSHHSVASSTRPNSAMSVKSNHSMASSTRPSSSRFPNTRRSPITEMKEEVKDLKAKNEENLKLIADQKAELERLKQQLSNQASQAQTPSEEEEEENRLLKTKEELLAQREKEIEELRVKLEEQEKCRLATASPSIMIQSDEESLLAEKEKELKEREAALEEQKRRLESEAPQIDEVATQLEVLKLQNLEAVNQLALKEKELEELRSSIFNNSAKEQKEEDKKEALEKIEELNRQLEAQKIAHEQSLRLHEEALAEKDGLLKEQKEALEALQNDHEEELRKLKTAQSQSVIALKKKHKQDRLEIEKQLETAKKEAESNPNTSVNLDEHLERLLQEVEQAEHTYTVQIQDLEQSHQSELDSLQNDQKAELNKLKRTQDLTRDKWSSRYIPTEAVSWPLPKSENLNKLRSTPSLVESKSKTLLRVLGSMPANQKPEPVLTPLNPKKVQVYYSSVSGNPVIKRNQEHIQQLLTSNNIKFHLVDVAASEAARQYAKKCNNNGKSEGRIKEFPQLYVGGEYRGQYEDVVYAIDNNQLEELLRAAAERNFTPEERAAIQKAEINEEMAAAVPTMPSLPPIENGPKLRSTRSVAKPIKIIKDYDEDEELFKELEKELKEGKINLDDL